MRLQQRVVAGDGAWLVVLSKNETEEGRAGRVVVCVGIVKLW